MGPKKKYTESDYFDVDVDVDDNNDDGGGYDV